MNLAIAETSTITSWQGVDGNKYTTKRTAEIASIAYLTSFVHDLESLDDFLGKLTSAAVLKEWLQQQMNGTVAELPKEAPPVSFIHAITVAKSQIMKNKDPDAEYPTINSRMLGEELNKHYILVKKP